jgi:hypothetical protein
LLGSPAVEWRTSIVALLVFVVVALGTVMWTAGSGRTRDPQTTIREGIDLVYRVTIAIPGAHGNEIADAALADHAKTVPGLMGQYFADPALTNLTSALAGAMSNQLADGRRDTAGGARSVEITEFSSTGDAADAVARALVWLHTEGVRADQKVIDTPASWWTYRLHLIRTSDGWRIDEFDASPEAGSEP